MPGVVKMINGAWLLVNSQLANAVACCCEGVCCKEDGTCDVTSTTKEACEECIPIGQCWEFAPEESPGVCPEGFYAVMGYEGQCIRITEGVTVNELCEPVAPAESAYWVQTGTTGPCGTWTLTRACCEGLCCLEGQTCCGGECCPAGACNDGVCEPCDCVTVTYSEDVGDPLGQTTCDAEVCHTETIQIPFGCGDGDVTVTITGSVDDELLIDGVIIEPGAYGSPCNPAHSVNHTFITSAGSFTVGFADNYHVLCGGDITICFAPEPPPP